MPPRPADQSAGLHVASFTVFADCKACVLSDVQLFAPPRLVCLARLNYEHLTDILDVDRDDFAYPEQTIRHQLNHRRIS